MIRARSWLLPAGLLLPIAAAAQPIDMSGGGPVEVTARGQFEWRQNDQEVIATVDCRAVRGDVTVLADRMVAHYRKKGTGPNAAGTAPAAAPATPAKPADPATDAENGGNEVYRLDAEGHVRILTPTDEAVGDKAVYDIDQAVLVMTGHAMRLTTPQDVMTARDSMEYWSQLHMSVGRGDAVVVTDDGRRIAADVLVAYSIPPSQQSPAGATPAAAQAPAAAGGKPADPLLAASGKLKRVEAFGNVDVRTQVDTVRGDRGVYVPETGISRVVGHVRITHGDDQMNGPAADVNMKTGIAHLISDPTQRVEGLLMPANTQPPPAGPPPSGKPAATAQPPAAGKAAP
jgi:lipopolysaccharide export system protein LptA